MLDRGCANSRPGSLGVPEMTWMDRPGFSLCAASLELSGPGFWSAWQGGREMREVWSIPDQREMEKN